MIGIGVGIYLILNPTVFRPQAASTGMQGAYPINVLVLKYFPLTPDGQNIDITVTGDVGEPYSVIKERTNNITNNLVQFIPKATSYLKYKDPASTPSIQTFITTTKEYTQPVPIKASHGRVNYPDYNKIMTDNNICNLVNNQGVREVWLFAYQGPSRPNSNQPYLDIDESKMSGPFGDISNSYRYNDMPVCNYTYRVLTFNYGRGTSEALHSWGHQIEAELSAVNQVVFRELFQGPAHPQETNENGRCGSVHNPPNARYEYDYENPISQTSDCENWDPNGFGQSTQISCETWSPGCRSNSHLRTDDNNPQLNYMIWNWQNLPGKNNSKTFVNQPFKNLWEIYGDFDRVMAYSKTFFLPIPSPIPSNAQSIQVVSPSGGEVFNIGSTYPITWNYTNIDYCYLQYRNNQQLSTISYLWGNQLAAKKYDWTVPVYLSSGMQFKIYMVCYKYGQSTSVTSESPGYFTLYSPNIKSDDDGDGFSTGTEFILGTNPNRACAQTASDSAWPADTNNNQVINGGDVSKIVPYVSGAQPYNRRYDLNLDGINNKDDVAVIAKYFLQSCNEINVEATPNPSVLAMYDIPNVADLIKDRRVDLFDFNQLVTDFAKTGTGIISDINKDNIVNIYDFNILMQNFGRTY